MPIITNRCQVPVYELKVAGDHVMRRRADDWINATHILKVAGFDKPARTRILEREVQKGVHEKIQGGYGKYQGTWVPLGEGRGLAEKHGVLDRIINIFDYVAGDHSPPPAPKHTTAASNRPKQNKPAPPPKKVVAQPGKVLPSSIDVVTDTDSPCSILSASRNLRKRQYALQWHREPRCFAGNRILHGRRRFPPPFPKFHRCKKA